MQNNEHYIYDKELNEILNDGFLKNLAAMGLAGALAYGSAQAGQKPASVKKPVTTASVKQSTLPPKLTTAPKSESMFDFISKWEGTKTKVYPDHTGKPTIGIGHYLSNTSADRNLINTLFGGKLNYDKLLNGTQTLTIDQIEKLFNVDVKAKEKVAAKLIPSYNTFDQSTKNAIVNALYRGDLGPKTIQHINNKDWANAAKEYLNHTNAKTGPEQIKTRMKTNAALFYKNVKK